MIFEIFKTGTHTSSNGINKDFTESDLDQIVNSYNPEEHEAPLTIGHPKDNSPAHGWIKKIFREGEKLFAEVDNLTDKLKDALQNKLFKKRSIALYPDFKLRHVGFVPIPSVKGLADIPDAELFALSDDENNLQTFENEFDVISNPDLYGEKSNSSDNQAQTTDHQSPTTDNNVVQVDLAFIESKLQPIIDFIEIFREEKLKSDEPLIKLDLEYFEDELNQKIENKKITPAVKDKILSIVKFLCSFDYADSDYKTVTKNFFEMFDSLIESFPQLPNLEIDFAEKPENEIISSEVFQYAEVDRKSRELHTKAINLMKKENCTYLTAVQKILIDK